MKILILGGTVFLGRHVVDAALAKGHEVTLFNRGKSNGDLFPELETLIGDRNGNLDALMGRKWDAVVDPSGYLPRQVKESATLLADSVEHYTFISSISVYDDFSQGTLTEESTVGVLEDKSVEEVTGETYGPLKALCEEAASVAMAGRVLNVRAGLIVGPHDPTDRFTYWPVRVERGGPIVAPPDPMLPVQFVDVRDLAAWIVQMAEQRTTGTYNATGPAELLTFQDFLHACKTTTGSDGEFYWTPKDVLSKLEVSPWIDLPLWVPAEMGGMLDTDITKALSTGLAFRPLAETIRDTAAWANGRPDEYEWRAGLSAEREEKVLADLG